MLPSGMSTSLYVVKGSTMLMYAHKMLSSVGKKILNPDLVNISHFFRFSFVTNNRPIDAKEEGVKQLRKKTFGEIVRLNDVPLIK